MLAGRESLTSNGHLERDEDHGQLPNEVARALQSEAARYLSQEPDASRATTKQTGTEAKPTEAKPAEAKPAEAKPAEAKPAEAKPAEAKPAEAKPAEAKPAEAKPAEAKPAEAKPAEAKPAEAKPAEAKPAENSATQSTLPVVLLTGFEPFDGQKLNSSWEAVKQLDGQTIAGSKVVTRQLPVVYATAGDALTKAISQTKPTIVILVGQQGGSSRLAIENTAENNDSSFCADNAGVLRMGHTPIVQSGPGYYKSTLPVDAIVKGLQQAGIEARTSESAGTFLCNHEFYLLEHHIATSAPNLRGGFVHVPYIPEQLSKDSNAPSMPLQTMVRGLKSVIATSVEAQKSGKIAGSQQPPRPALAVPRGS